MLTRFADLPLIDRYDIYQRLVDYWVETMQDDVHLIVAEGWTEAAQPRRIIEDRSKRLKQTADLTVRRQKYKMDLVPPELIVNRFFAMQRDAVHALEIEQEAASRSVDEFVDEHTGPDAPLEDATNDNGKVTKARIRETLNALADEPEEGDEDRDALIRCLELVEAKTAATQAARDARLILDREVLAQYTHLTEVEIQALVVADKWLARLRVIVGNEVERETDRLAERVKELGQRYARTLSALERDVGTHAAQVAHHLGVALNSASGAPHTPSASVPPPHE